MKFESSIGPIYYDRHGDPNDPLIVLFHVLGGNRNFFKKQIDALSENYSVLTWDLPWHGASVVPDEPLNFKTIEMVFIELLDHLNIDMAVLSGVSLGGLLVQYIAVHNQDRILAIHVDGAPPMHLGYNRFIHFAAWIHIRLSKLVPKKVLSILAAGLLSTDEASKTMIKDHFNTFDKKHILKLFGGTKDEVLKGIKEPVKKPMLITHGAHDFRFIMKRCLQFHEATNYTSYVIVHGGGHLHIKTSPRAYSEVLLRFLETIY